MTTFFVKPGPRVSVDFKRIINLPQRDAQEIGQAIAEPLSEMLRTAHGTMVLRPLQALALAEARDYDGVFVALPVGEGKTIVSFLLPTVMEAKRALLLVPGALLDKTRQDFLFLSKHWKAHDHYNFVSYEYLSTHPEILKITQPDLIIADEAHKLKNLKAACTKRVYKYWKEKGDVRFVPLSGTLASRSFFDYWHLLMMALPPGEMTLPYDRYEAELWASALDVKPQNRAALGCLKHFGPTLETARKGYGDFLKKVPGVIASDSSEIGASLIINVDKIDDCYINSNYERLVKKWELPNGEEICTAIEFYRHAREIACGFFYVWDKPAPDYWAMARLAYGRFIRGKLLGSKKFEAPSQIDAAYSSEPEVVEWHRVEKDFTPVTRPVWFTDQILRRAIEAVGNSGLIWYQHRAVGALLSQMGIAVYGNQGKEIRTGRSIYDQKGGVCAVSIKALSEGFNLQAWYHNVVLGSPANGRTWEQMLGRTHRSGQEADEVIVDYLVTLPFRVTDLEMAIEDSRYIAATTAQKQKLTIADFIGLEQKEEDKWGGQKERKYSIAL